MNKENTEPMPVAEFEEIITDTCQGSKREVLLLVLKGIVDKEIPDIPTLDETKEKKLGYNSANATLRAHVQKLIESNT